MAIGVGTCFTEIGGYIFEGPFDTPLALEDRPGVYVVLDVKGSDRRVVDVGEAPAVLSRVKNHERKICWVQRCRGTLKVAAHYTSPAQPAAGRRIRNELVERLRPPCTGTD
ncbi:MAG: hypothetical protein ACM3NF_06250 [Gemmatimonadota bacterium]